MDNHKSKRINIWHAILIAYWSGFVMIPLIFLLFISSLIVQKFSHQILIVCIFTFVVVCILICILIGVWLKIKLILCIAGLFQFALVVYSIYVVFFNILMLPDSLRNRDRYFSNNQFNEIGVGWGHIRHFLRRNSVDDSVQFISILSTLNVFKSTIAVSWKKLVINY